MALCLEALGADDGVETLHLVAATRENGISKSGAPCQNSGFVGHEEFLVGAQCFNARPFVDGSDGGRELKSFFAAPRAVRRELLFDSSPTDDLEAFALPCVSN